MNRNQSQNGFRGFAAKSMILSALVRFSDFLRGKIAESFIGHLLAGNERHGGNGLFRYLGQKLGFRRRISIPFKRFMAKHIEKSALLTWITGRIAALPDLKLNCIGIFYFAIGLYSSISYLIQRFALNRTATPQSQLIYGLIAVAVGGILTASQKRCGEAICDSRILSSLLFNTLGIRREPLQSKGKPMGRGDASFLFGIAAGALGTLTSLPAVLLALPLLVLAYAILLLPECGVVLLLLILPFFGTFEVGLLTVFVTISWLLKLMRGKRTLAMLSPDAAAICFGIVLFFGGTVSVTPTESLRAALIMIAMMAGYFITVNLIRTAEWVERCVKALLFSFGVTAIVGVSEYLFGLAPQNWLDVSMLTIIPGRAVSFFGNPNVLAEFLILGLPFAVAAMALSRPGDRRFGYLLLMLLSLGCLVVTWSRGGWIAAIVALLLLFLLTSRAVIAKLFCGFLLLPAFLAILPDSIMIRFLSAFRGADSSLSYRFGIWSGVDGLLSDCFAGGIGVGETAFRRVYPLYSLSAIEAAPHTHNLYTQIAVSVGFTGLAVFLAFLVIFLRHYVSYTVTGQQDDPRLRLTAAAGFSGIVGFLVMGMADYVWYNSRIFLLFWMILGLTSAAIRTGARERIVTPLDGPHLDIDCKRPAAFYRGRKDR